MWQEYSADYRATTSSFAWATSLARTSGLQRVWFTSRAAAASNCPLMERVRPTLFTSPKWQTRSIGFYLPAFHLASTILLPSRRKRGVRFLIGTQTFAGFLELRRCLKQIQWHCAITTSRTVRDRAVPSA